MEMMIVLSVSESTDASESIQNIRNTVDVPIRWVDGAAHQPRKQVNAEPLQAEHHVAKSLEKDYTASTTAHLHTHSATGTHMQLSAQNRL
jgi:hypothetical protein